MVKVRMGWENLVKEITLMQLVRFYNMHAFTHFYMIAFNWQKMVIVAYVTGDELAKVTMLDKASRGKGNSMRFKPNKSQKLYMLNNCETFTLCTVEEVETAFKACKYNRGEVVERFITELFGQTWVKDRIPFTEDGDLTVNGIAYQIKYESATFITEKQAKGMA